MGAIRKLNVKERVCELWKQGIKDYDFITVVINQELDHDWIEKDTHKDKLHIDREVIKQYVDDFDYRGSCS